MFSQFGGARVRQLSIIAMGIAAFSPALAQAGAIRVTTPWLRETATGQSAGGGFLSISNSARTADALIGGTSPVAAKVEVHTMSMDGGVMRMRPLKDGLAIPAGQSVDLKPGGLHIMLIGLKRPLKRGETVPVALSFAKAGTVMVQFTVQPITYAAAEGGHDRQR